MNFYNKTLLAAVLISSGFIFAGPSQGKRRSAVVLKPVTVKTSMRAKRDKKIYTKPVLVAVFKNAKAGYKNGQQSKTIRSTPVAVVAKQLVTQTSKNGMKNGPQTPVKTVVAELQKSLEAILAKQAGVGMVTARYNIHVRLRDSSTGFVEHTFRS